MAVSPLRRQQPDGLLTSHVSDCPSRDVTDATQDVLMFLQHSPRHKSVTAARTPPTNEPSACLWTNYLAGTSFVSPLCRPHIRDISVGFVITPPDGWSGFRLPSETINLAPLQNVRSGSEVRPVSYSARTAGFIPGLHRSGCEISHSAPPPAEVKNEWSPTSTPLMCLNGVYRSNFILKKKQKILHETKPRP